MGGGSAGCVLANRLSAENEVLLVEAGPYDSGMFFSSAQNMHNLNMQNSYIFMPYKHIKYIHFSCWISVANFLSSIFGVGGEFVHQYQ